MKKVLILGASGMLGSMVLDFLSTKKELKITTPSRQQLYKINFKNYDYVINCIGIIKQKLNDPKEAILINSLLPHSIAEKAPSTKIIQVGTDCVFSGKTGSYSEKDAHDATDFYGKTKSLGEVNAKNFFNIRTSIIGPDRKSKVALFEWFLSQKKNAIIPGFVNHRWNGITTLHFAKLCYAIINNDLEVPKSLHFLPSDSVNKYKLLKIFSKYFAGHNIVIRKTKAATRINRTLSTVYKKTNLELWKAMEYVRPPTIDSMVQELSEYVKERNFYG